jgi:outer membrane protein assembly factor BamB
MKRLTVVSLLLMAGLLLSACSTGASTSSWPGLAADQNNAYVANGQFIYAVQISNGVKVWQYPAQAGTEQFHTNPVVTPDGQVLVGSSGRDYGLYSLDAKTGSPKWAKPYTADDQWMAAPLVVGDTVYAPNNNGKLYAISLATGQLAWAPVNIGGPLWSTPITNGKLLFLTSLDHRVYAIDLATHKLAWSQPRDLGGSITSAPLIAADGSALFVGSFAGKIFALDPGTGRDVWRPASLSAWAWNTPVQIEKNLYVGDIAGNLYALSTADGKQVWPQITPDTAITASPLAIPQGVVIATESGILYAYKLDRTVLWSTENNLDVKNIGGQLYTTPILAGDRIVVAPMNGKDMLYAVNAQDGTLLWQFNGK